VLAIEREGVPMKRVWLVVALLVPVAAIGVLAFEARFENQRQARTIAQLRRQLAESTVETPADTSPPAPRSVYVVPPTPVGSAPPASPVVYEDRGAVTGHNETTVADLDTKRDQLELTFARDHTDPSWTVRASTDARRKIAAVLPTGSELHSFECHETLCRVESTHDSQTKEDAFLKAAFLDPDTQIWNSGGFSAPVGDQPGPDGRIEIVTFIGREGRLGVPTESP